MLQAAVIVAAWSWDAHTTEGSVDEEAKILLQDMNAACDAWMPRSMPNGGHHQAVHWWTHEIGQLRTRCVRAHRVFQRVRRRPIRDDEEEVSRCYGAYREVRRTLQREIKIAKAQSWRDLVQAFKSDP